MASNKYQCFETNRFYGVFSSEGEPEPIAIGRSESEVLDALVRTVAEDDGLDSDTARAIVDSMLDNGLYFTAPIALRGAFKSEGDRGEHSRTDWIDKAFDDGDAETKRRHARALSQAQGALAATRARAEGSARGARESAE